MAEAARAGALVECAPGLKALAEAMRPLLVNLDLAKQQGQRGQAYVATVHDWANIARRSLQIYAGEGGLA
jgi:hypothetical protein